MLLTELGLQGHNRTPWARGWQSVNPYNPAPEPRPKAVPAEQLARAAGVARAAGLVNRKDVEEAVRLALQAATTHSPPTPPPFLLANGPVVVLLHLLLLQSYTNLTADS